MTTDTAALAANDKTLGDHLAAAQASDQPPPADSTTAGEIKPDAVPTNPEPAPEIPTQREADLQRRLTAAEERLRYYEDRRNMEQSLLAERDSAISSIESAKNAKASAQKDLAEVEAKIAALLKSPVPQAFDQTPIGRVISEAQAGTEPVPPVLGWTKVLPEVPAESVRLLVGVGDELPTVDAILGAELAPQAMEGEKRALKAAQTVTCYGTPWLVTKLWQDEEMGALRANVVPLLTKDEWQQGHEEKYGRAVADFDQSDEAKDQRQRGGLWCGLVVKVGRKAFVVGPQEQAMHLAYDPPEAEQDAQPWPVGGEITHETFGRGTVLAYGTDDAGQAVRFSFGTHGEKVMLVEFCRPKVQPWQPTASAPAVEPWADVAKRATEIIEATGQAVAAYALQYKLPYIALAKLLSTGIGPDDASVADALRSAFPPFDAEDETEDEDDDKED